MACDLRMVADTVRSATGTSPDSARASAAGASTRLSRLVGLAQAKDLILTGKDRRPQALRIGLAQRVVPRRNSPSRRWPWPGDRARWIRPGCG
jgi:enoyl-CoA hydratase/carnithine racemase